MNKSKSKNSGPRAKATMQDPLTKGIGHTKFKDSELGRVPQTWKAKNLGDIVKFSGGSAFKETFQGKDSGAYPFIKVSDMNLVENSRYITKSNNWISERVRSQAKIKLFPPNAVVFAKVGAALLINRRRQLIRETAIDNNMMAAIPSNCDSDFLYFFLQTIDLKNFVQDGAIPSVNQNQMESIVIDTPPMPEQKKIAAILTSVDEVIEATQTQINKLQALKKATMQELLTKGIGHTKFKDSELGRIPKSWVTTTLGDAGIFSKGKGISKNEISSEGIPCIRYAEIYTDYNFQIKKFKSFIRREVADASKRFKKNDIIFAGSGETAEEIGKSVSFTLDCEAYVGGDAIILSPVSGIDSLFLSYQLNDNIRRKQRMKLGQGSSVIHIYSSGLADLIIVLPPIPEQKKIASVLTTIDDHIEMAHHKLAQIQSLKQSLMQDLLSGIVRVTA